MSVKHGKIRILETIRQGKIGGGESHVLDLVATLNRQRYEPVVLSFTDGPMISALRKMNIAVHVIHSEKAFDIPVWKQVKRFLREQQVHLVHVHGTRANTNVLWAARNLGLPVIYTVHGWSFHEGQHPVMKWARTLAEKYITRKAQVNICVSESNRQTGDQAFRGLNAVVIRNGINTARFNPDASYPDIRAEYSIPANHLVLGYIVRMTYQKDPLTMIRAFAEALKLVPQMTLLMIGEGELKEAARNAAMEAGITEQVRFDNFRQDVPAVLNGIDIYCLPSLWEGFPIGVLEAMAMGRPVIASDVDGTREAIENGENGLLVPAADSHALSAAIVTLATDAPLRQRLGQKAIASVTEHYQVADMTGKIEAIYDQLYKP
ncbi:glycosyltransferase family 4 protein [Chitinophaga sp. Mgbs1]|uniref:Glycosyltransferase family 4 protein n=1 Tax=Chitinophaga solisilvae TaxID=1233460 RepID=A0A3S1AY17_9BACT|nr:glycosyltransferase family 4 protein [Chitinophaga solisilvae]